MIKILLSIANFTARWTRLFQTLKKSDPLTRLVRYLKESGKDWSLIQRFTYDSAIIILLGMVGIGWWVGKQITEGSIREATIATALYMDSFISPHVQELDDSDAISTKHIDMLNNQFSANNLGQRTISIKIWNKNNQLAYSNIPSLMGQKFPATEDLTASWNGEVTGEISDLQEAENIEERRLSAEPLLEIYSPVRLNDTNQIIAVAEFYQRVDTLEASTVAVQRRGWLVVGTTMTVIYLLLIGFVQLAGNRIRQQELELKNQVAQLLRLLSYNKEVAERVRLATANTVTLNESFLRRTGTELHDGPVQEISLALLRLDKIIAQNEICGPLNPNSLCNNSLPIVQSSLQTALQEMRAIAAGFGLPHLEELTLYEVILHAVRSHEQRSKTEVSLNTSDLPEHTSTPIKIAVYRFIQEALNNAHRHTGGKSQAVQVACKSKQLQIDISDLGSGFIYGTPSIIAEDQLGWAGMSERIESLGGTFTIDGTFKEGTKLIARLPL